MREDVFISLDKKRKRKYIHILIVESAKVQLLSTLKQVTNGVHTSRQTRHERHHLILLLKSHTTLPRFRDLTPRLADNGQTGEVQVARS